jgi:hypothetical protein
MFFATLVPRSINTIETVCLKQMELENMNRNSLDKCEFIPCSNIQKDLRGGLDGFMLETSSNCKLQAFECASENIYDGISVVKCEISKDDNIEMIKNKTKYQELLNTFCEKYISNTYTKTPSIQELMPNGTQEDFFWLSQTSEFSASVQVSEAIVADHNSNSLNFYNAYKCCAVDSSSENHDGDTFMRDGTPWEPILSGRLGIYTTEVCGATVSYIVCVSGIPLVGSEVMRALKSDLVNHISVYDFCESKELWYLQNMAKRNRLRLILKASRELNIKVPMKFDIYSHIDETDKYLAIETYGIETEKMYSDIFYEYDIVRNISTPCSMVRYFKGCIDISHHRGPIPIFIGADVGFIVLLPPNYMSKTIPSDFNSNYINFVESPDFKAKYVFPVTNLIEKQNNSLIQIKHEQLCIPKLTNDALFYNMQYSNSPVSAHLLSLPEHIDISDGMPLFYGIMYQNPNATTLCPRHTTNFIPNKRSVHNDGPQAVKAGNGPDEDSTVSENIQKSTNKTSILEYINSPITVPTCIPLFAFGEYANNDISIETNMVLQWDDTIISTLQVIHDISKHTITHIYLSPFCTFDLGIRA